MKFKDDDHYFNSIKVQLRQNLDDYEVQFKYISIP